jgi:hypothetical protein
MPFRQGVSYFQSAASAAANKNGEVILGFSEAAYAEALDSQR